MTNKTFIVLLAIPALCLVALDPPRAARSRIPATQTKPKKEFVAKYLLSGESAPRDTLSECTQAIGDFEARLTAAGIVTVAPMKCVPYAQSDVKHIIHFEATSEQEFALSTGEGSTFSSLSYCHLERLRMVEVEQEQERNVVIDSACVRKGAEEYAPVYVLRSDRTLQAAAE